MQNDSNQPFAVIEPVENHHNKSVKIQSEPEKFENPELSTEHPSSVLDIYLSFTVLALQGFGGVVAIVQRELVEKKRWMTQQEFVEEWAVAQIMPGPNVVNLSLMLGHRFFGLRGALAALAGMLSLPLCLVLLIAVLYSPYANHPGVAGALRGMSAVSAGLIMATGLKLASSLNKHPLGKLTAGLFSLASFTAIALFRIPLSLVLLSLGSCACLLTYHHLEKS